MIAFAQQTAPSSSSTTNDKFLTMLPAIQQQARLAFRARDPETREELTAEVVANSFCAYQRLVERGKQDVAHPTPLSKFAIRQICAGRRVGTKLNINDVSSPYARALRGIVVERLDKFDPEDAEWREAVVEDRRAGPAQTAAARLDLSAWLQKLGRTKRRIALKLATGEATSAVARIFGVTAGRVSQLRQELKASWELFQNEPAVA